MTAGLFEQIVEHIAELWYEAPCPPHAEDHCNPLTHDWSIAQDYERESARENVRFILRAIGIDG